MIAINDAGYCFPRDIHAQTRLFTLAPRESKFTGMFSMTMNHEQRMHGRKFFLYVYSYARESSKSYLKSHASVIRRIRFRRMILSWNSLTHGIIRNFLRARICRRWIFGNLIVSVYSRVTDLLSRQIGQFGHESAFGNVCPSLTDHCLFQFAFGSFSFSSVNKNEIRSRARQLLGKYFAFDFFPRDAMTRWIARIKRIYAM